MNHSHVQTYFESFSNCKIKSFDKKILFHFKSKADKSQNLMTKQVHMNASS